MSRRLSQAAMRLPLRERLEAICEMSHPCICSSLPMLRRFLRAWHLGHCSQDVGSAGLHPRRMYSDGNSEVISSVRLQRKGSVESAAAQMSVCSGQQGPAGTGRG